MHTANVSLQPLEPPQGLLSLHSPFSGLPLPDPSMLHIVVMTHHLITFLSPQGKIPRNGCACSGWKHPSEAIGEGLGVDGPTSPSRIPEDEVLVDVRCQVSLDIHGHQGSGFGALDGKQAHTIRGPASQAFTRTGSHHQLSWGSSLQTEDLGLGLHNRVSQFLS